MKSFWLDTHPIVERGAPLVGIERYDTVVVGAGLTGVATASLLARAGQRVCLVEARTVGAVTTGGTTGKVSLLQGAHLSAVRRHHGDEVLSAYVQGNLAGQAWLRRYLELRGLAHQVRTAYTYAGTDEGLRTLDTEMAASTVAGLPVNWNDDSGLPYPVAGAIELADQVQIHPTELLDSLLGEFLELGGVLHTGCRVREVKVGARCVVGTSSGTLEADRLVLATGTAILDRGGHFARLEPQRSYVLAFTVPAPVPRGMYLSIDSPSRSLRTAGGPDEDVLLVGGNGHPVGRGPSPRGQVADLADWTLQQFPGAERTHAWSAQDYQSTSMLPLVGPMPLTDGRVFAATGYAKWGMANAAASAIRLTEQLTGDLPDWARVLDAAHPSGADLADGSRLNAGVAVRLARGWFAGESRAMPPEPPPEGEGRIGRLHSRPVARSTANGTTCTVSAVCTHLGGIVTWNDAELSWDCPLHGSRFDAAGRVLEGPAVTDLEVLDRGPASAPGVAAEDRRDVD